MFSMLQRMFHKLISFLFPQWPHKETTTVRYTFNTLALGAILFGLASILASDSSYITLKTTPSSVHEGETFYMEIIASAHVPVNAVDLKIEYPESKMRIESIDTGTSVITLWAEEPYAKSGYIYLRGGMYKKGFIGEHTIARVRATALATGVAHVNTLDATFIAGDGLGTEVVVKDTDSGSTDLTITRGEDNTLSGTVAVTIITDIDGDGEVTLRDISSFMAAWFTKEKTFDFNGDGRMTFIDFSILLSDSFFK